MSHPLREDEGGHGYRWYEADPPHWKRVPLCALPSDFKKDDSHIGSEALREIACPACLVRIDALLETGKIALHEPEPEYEGPNPIHNGHFAPSCPCIQCKALRGEKPSKPRRKCKSLKAKKLRRKGTTLNGGRSST